MARRTEAGNALSGRGGGCPSTSRVLSAAPSSVERTAAAPASAVPGGNPTIPATSGVATAAETTRRATSGAGGFEISSMTSVAGSASSAWTANVAIAPPTALDRSRPPTPMT